MSLCRFFVDFKRLPLQESHGDSVIAAAVFSEHLARAEIPRTTFSPLPRPTAAFLDGAPAEIKFKVKTASGGLRPFLKEGS